VVSEPAACMLAVFIVGGLIVVPMCAAAWESALVPRPLVQR
jgi:hypothetical protein